MKIPCIVVMLGNLDGTNWIEQTLPYDSPGVGKSTAFIGREVALRYAQSRWPFYSTFLQGEIDVDLNGQDLREVR